MKFLTYPLIGISSLTKSPLCLTWKIASRYYRFNCSLLNTRPCLTDGYSCYTVWVPVLPDYRLRVWHAMLRVNSLTEAVVRTPISAAKCSCRQENLKDSFKFSSHIKKGIIFNFITIRCLSFSNGIGKAYYRISKLW